MSETLELHEKMSEPLEEDIVSHKGDEHKVDDTAITACPDTGGGGDGNDDANVDADADDSTAHVIADGNNDAPVPLPVMEVPAASQLPVAAAATEEAPPPISTIPTTTTTITTVTQATTNEAPLSNVLDESHTDIDEDLEDGEIDDDDDEDGNNDDTAAAATVATSASAANDGNTSAATVSAADSNNVKGMPQSKLKPQQQQIFIDLTTKVQTIDLSIDQMSPPIGAATTTTAAAAGSAKTAASKISKPKKGQPLDDDHMLSVEKALSKVLKKSGVEPQMPKFLETRQQDGKDHEITAALVQSRSSRRRKRKKQRDEKEKERERKDKKKPRFESPDPHASILLDDEDDVDDFEMLNVRGGSPSTVQPPPQSYMHLPPSQYAYDSGEESYTSYESAESIGGGGGGGAGGGDGGRRRRRGKKDRKRRDRGGRNRDEERSGARGDKRNRRDSPDDKHRQEPRKLELCKFYLMECCAKKDKCSYMHSDFPCKYYYLGMECVNKDTCKFMHADPLSEQLRNILLKHLETAPKEILGNFKRISRDTAISMMSKRHEELCKEYSIENSWTNLTNIPSNSNRRGGNNTGSGNLNDNMHHQHQQQQQMLQQQQLSNQPHNNIPSLFDIVVKPPVTIGGGVEAAATKGDKHRKSRWNDYLTENGLAPDAALAEKTGPSYLDLSNLTGIMSEEHIEKLTKLGITNLEQVNQLTVGQMRQIGIDVAEISEIQSKALSGKEGNDNESTSPLAKRLQTDSLSTTRDVDMRFIPSATTSNASDLQTKSGSGNSEAARDLTMSSNSNSDSNSGVVRVDYSQYLKDSNLAFDRSDAYDDERDDEQLVIDDDNIEHEDNARMASISSLVAAATANTTTSHHDNDNLNDEPKLSGGVPFNPLNPFRSTYNNIDNNKSKGFNPFRTQMEDKTIGSSLENDRYYSTRRQRERSRSRSPSRSHSRSRSRSPSRSHSRSRSRSRSRTPTRSQSTTPEASQSPNPEEPTAQPVYERTSMYDFNATQAEEDERQLALKSMKADKDMRFLQSSSSSGVSGLSDLDLCLPFQAVTNYTPATEIDGSITSHLPMTYKLREVTLPIVSYSELRRNLSSNTQTPDPRLRRILGLPETRTSVALPRAVRKMSNSIASPEPDESPKYYTPPSGGIASSSGSGSTSSNRVHDERKHSSSSKSSTVTAQPRLDPRRGAATATTASSAAVQNTNNANAANTASAATSSSTKIRNLLQNSEWFRNLNSNTKIGVNQQLAHLTNELKKFHQDTSPNKIFDFDIIMKNNMLQEILKKLGVFINDNIEIEDVDRDNKLAQDLGIMTPEMAASFAAGKGLPDVSLPPPQLEFLRRPPPLLPVAAAGAVLNPSMAPNRPSLLGIPPFNPFSGNLPEPVMSAAAAFLGGASLMGPGPRVGFGGFPGMPQGARNFNMDNNRNHRNPTNRRNFL